jgi:hypothetical protein
VASTCERRVRRGLIQSRGGQVIEIRPGDTIYTPPGKWHWHGAAPDHFMTHLSMTEGVPQGQGPETDWGDLVTKQGIAFRMTSPKRVTDGCA